MYSKNNKRSDSWSPFKLRIELGSGFLLFFAFINFFDDCGIIAALVPAVIAHETGHILAILLLGAKPKRLSATLSGFSLDYSGDLNENQELLIAIAGPVFGLASAVLFAKLGKLIDSEYLIMSAGLGFVINVFNLLPAIPLDGGHVLIFALKAIFGAKIAQTIAAIMGYLISIAILVLGLYFILKGYGFAFFLAGLWLFILQQNKSCKYS